MSKKKKIILVVVSVIVVLGIIGAMVWWLGEKNKTEDTLLDGETSKVNKLYTELVEKQEYSFTETLDEQNKIYYAKKDEMGYIDTTYQGKNSKFIIKDGNSYLLVDDQKACYVYQNNETDLRKVEVQLEATKDKEYVVGKEKIDGKQYNYEEYEDVSEFLIKDIEETEEQTYKTRFYFKNNQLVYIKTIVGDYEEILKVDITDNIDDELFEIPSEYEQI